MKTATKTAKKTSTKTAALPHVRTTDVVTYKFATRDAAWTFMRACDAAKLAAGFPALMSFTVEVGVATWMDREAADALAGSVPVAYAFKGGAIVYG